MYQPMNQIDVPVGAQNVAVTCVNFMGGTTNVNITTNGNTKEQGITKDAGSGNILSFHDIHYTVQYKEGICKKANKTILNGIRGVFKPGLNAIMGPTGSGKTTLLDILAARKDSNGLTGKVLINSKPLPSDFRLISGYVVQNDVVMATLTVRENLAFSAALRLPSLISKKERQQRVEDVIQELGLEECANKKIGNEFIHGVSGGEKKRTGVGIELIIKPGILFLDEPTSGLDASTAGSVMRLLEELTRKRHSTIIFSIHQPRDHIYSLFNRLHLLSRGETVYHGATMDVLDFFRANGYVREEQDTRHPADFLLDSIQENEARASSKPNTTKADAVDVRSVEGSSMLNTVDMQDAKTEAYYPHELLCECFKKSDYYSHMATEVDAMYEKFKFEEVTKQKYNYRTSFVTQLISAIVFSILVGLIYFQLGRDPASAIQDRIGALFVMVVQSGYVNVNSLRTFMTEQLIFL
ncbi:broad substrate specificity ATP-binding cassette transporter ABCG2-like [Amphiura filiformis]|uniref:broad substrate specificity ATP-binding cassette transporter ABCG2-like n=1 Tax=Amphiura filiformis TaxID=82378 RepID=UPI003B21EA42